jgi:tagaturonate reductase
VCALRAIVCAVAREWQAPGRFVDWLGQHCVWGNTLVDRIVSDPIEPVGAVAEPYALWAVERQPQLVLRALTAPGARAAVRSTEVTQ